MNLSPKYLIKILEQNGFVYKRYEGSHQLYYNPDTNKTVIVPFHRGKILKKDHSSLYLNKPELMEILWNRHSRGASILSAKSGGNFCF